MNNQIKIHIQITILIFVIFSWFCEITLSQEKNGKHLFILSGQSNMELLRPKESLEPILMDQFRKQNVIVVKFAKGTQPIRKWYRKWKPKTGHEPKAEPVLYDSLLVRVQKTLSNRNVEIDELASVTFVWMQGERDARKSFGDVYEESLLGLYKQLSDDLKRTDMNFVIGRLSDCGLKKKGWPHWQMIREIQVKVAGSNSRFGWVNSDDLNTGINRNGIYVTDDIHMTKEGYIELGKRFAIKAIELIQQNKK